MTLCTMFLFVALERLSWSGLADVVPCITKEFEEPVANKALLNHVISTPRAKTAKICEIHCFIEIKCESYNFGPNEDGDYLCELSDSDDVRDPDDLRARQDFLYRATKNPCGTAQCPPNSRCYSDFEHETYLCVCSPGFTGDKCESAEAASKGYDPENPAISCEDVLLNRPESRSGAYYLKTEKGGVAHTYCHMDVIPGCGGGGWTLVMKIDGNEDTFSYHSKYWSNKNTFGEISGTTGFDNEETKMPSYWSNNFTQICLGMRVGNVTEWLVINKQANSLHSLVADNNYKPTSLGRDKWKSLIDESSLQLECNKEGFNVKCPTAREHSASTRIGIISNNEKHCNSCDSRIGIGMGGTRGGVDVTNSCGNEADPFKSDNGKKHIKANCYILIK